MRWTGLVVSTVSPHLCKTAHYVIVFVWKHKNNISTGRCCTIPSYKSLINRAMHHFQFLQLSDIKFWLKGALLVTKKVVNSENASCEACLEHTAHRETVSLHYPALLQHPWTAQLLGAHRGARGKALGSHQWEWEIPHDTTKTVIYYEMIINAFGVRTLRIDSL